MPVAVALGITIPPVPIGMPIVTLVVMELICVMVVDIESVIGESPESIDESAGIEVDMESTGMDAVDDEGLVVMMEEELVYEAGSVVLCAVSVAIESVVLGDMAD